MVSWFQFFVSGYTLFCFNISKDGGMCGGDLCMLFICMGEVCLWLDDVCGVGVVCLVT